MTLECARCDATIPDDAPRYTRRSPGGEPTHFCSLNCVAGTDEHDETAVRASLFDAVAAE